MRLPFLTTAMLVVASAVAAPQSGPVPSTIVLTGVTTILGDSRVCLRVTFEDDRPEEEFMLAEGQSKYGIRLLSVDVRAGMATINEQDRYTRNISICQPPGLVSGAGGSINTGFSSDGDTAAAAGNGGARHAAGTNGVAGAAGGGGAGASDSAAKTGDSSTGSSNDSGSAEADKLYQWWVKEAEKIEQARIETADRVSAGEWEAYPLTPLTPSDTPAQLIGTNSVFMDHGPGVLLSSQ